MNRIPFLKKILIVEAVFILVFSALYYLGYADMVRIGSRMSQLSSVLSERAERERNVDTVKRSVEARSADIATVDASLVPPDGDVTFIEEIENLAKREGLTVGIDSLSFADVGGAESGLSAFDIKIRTSGQWAPTYTFLRQIETLPIKVSISSVALSSPFGDQVNPVRGEGDWRLSLSVRVLKKK